MLTMANPACEGRQRSADAHYVGHPQQAGREDVRGDQVCTGVDIHSHDTEPRRPAVRRSLRKSCPSDMNTARFSNSTSRLWGEWMLTRSQCSWARRRAIQSTISAVGPALTLKYQYSSAAEGWEESMVLQRRNPRRGVAAQDDSMGCEPPAGTPLEEEEV